MLYWRFMYIIFGLVIFWHRVMPKDKLTNVQGIYV